MRSFRVLSFEYRNNSHLSVILRPFCQKAELWITRIDERSDFAISYLVVGEVGLGVFGGSGSKGYLRGPTIAFRDYPLVSLEIG